MKKFTPSHLAKSISWGILSKLVLVSLFFSLILSAKFVNDFYHVETWFLFEPDEEYKLEGSLFYIDGRKDEQRWFDKTSAIIKADEIQKTAENSWSSTRSSVVKSKNSLGLKLSWDRVGSHYLDIIPASPNIVQVTEFPAKEIEEISIWIWSGHYDHEFSAIFNRNSGLQYVIPMTKLNFKGWKKVVVKIPSGLKAESKDAYFADEEFYFDRFRIYTHPREKITNIFIFLDNFEVLRKINYKTYDGEELINEIKRDLGIGNQILKE